MKTTPAVRTIVIILSSLGFVTVITIGGILVLFHLVEVAGRPTQAEAAQYLDSNFKRDELRSWADLRLANAETNEVVEGEKPWPIAGPEAYETLESPDSVHRQAPSKQNRPPVFHLYRASGTNEAKMENWEDVSRDEFKGVLIYPTNSRVDHSDKTTFLITNHIYVRITR